MLCMSLQEANCNENDVLTGAQVGVLRCVFGGNGAGYRSGTFVNFYPMFFYGER
jgi:hypothetical protein